MRPISKEDPPKSPYYKMILSKSPDTINMVKKNTSARVKTETTNKLG